jgi:iron complex outermembrane receptor protein
VEQGRQRFPGHRPLYRTDHQSRRGRPVLGNDLALRAQAFTNIKGNQLGRVPHFSSSASISKTTNIRDVGKLDFFIQANYRSAFWYRVFNNPLVDRVPHQF